MKQIKKVYILNGKIKFFPFNIDFYHPKTQLPS